MKPDIFSESRFLTIPSAFERFDAPVRGEGPVESTAMTFGTEKPPDREKKSELTITYFDTDRIYNRDGQTDGQTVKA